MFHTGKIPRRLRLRRPDFLVNAATISILALMTTEAAAASACTVRFPFCDNCSRRISIVTKKNTPCYVDYTMKNGTILSQTVIRRGSGIYGTANSFRGAYQPKPGFVGKDQFVVEIQYQRGETRLVTTLRAFVDVKE